MERLSSYEQYAKISAGFKKDKPRCSTNKLLMRDEVAALIEAEKFYWEQYGDALWFFADEGYFYSAQLFAPAGRAFLLPRQDKDVLAELMGKGERYDEDTERGLLGAGFEKHAEYYEFECQLDESIAGVKEKLSSLRPMLKEYGFVCRKAVKADVPALYRFWLERLGRDSYNVQVLTAAQVADMERYGRCIVICDPQGAVAAACIYFKRNNICFNYLTASSVSGLVGLVHCEMIASAYREGCSAVKRWVREDNRPAIDLGRGIDCRTGKFFRQFVRRAKTQREQC